MDEIVHPRSFNAWASTSSPLVSMEEGPFWLVGSRTTSLEGAHLLLVDLVAHCRSHGVGNFDDRLWGISMILVIASDGAIT